MAFVLVPMLVLTLVAKALFVVSAVVP
ncbi:MAG: hypothetical protein JWM53_5923, partial [bacterium]|nr:hypothetical protein [bacterium]